MPTNSVSKAALSVELESEVVVSPVGIVSSCSWVGDEVPLTDETC